jgi:hypothetical protein
MDDALRAYGAGHADGLAGDADEGRVVDPDYRVGLADGQLAKFESDLVAAIRRALGGDPK